MNRFETLEEVTDRLARENKIKTNAVYGKSAYPSRWALPVSLRLFTIVTAILLLGMLLLGGFAMHEAGIITPLNPFYEWAHNTFGGGEPMARLLTPFKYIW